jgi:hypothetical protein
VTFPAAKPGLVIRYSFLWSHEKDAGAEEGSKDRPCAIVVAAPRRENGDITVIVAPITHAPPADQSDSLEIPTQICRSLGLDGQRHWLRLDELNRFAWPGYDLRTIPGRPVPTECSPNLVRAAPHGNPGPSKGQGQTFKAETNPERQPPSPEPIGAFQHRLGGAPR